MDLQQIIITALRSELGDVTDHLETHPTTKRVGGVVISSAFVNTPHKQRQDRLWQIIDRTLDPSQRALVGPIAALTPIDAELSEVEAL